jgi:hypothetical protein
MSAYALMTDRAKQMARAKDAEFMQIYLLVSLDPETGDSVRGVYASRGRATRDAKRYRLAEHYIETREVIK